MKRKNRYQRFYSYITELIGYEPEAFKRVQFKKLKVDGYMPLTIEAIPYQHPDDSEQHDAISLCHYGIQNGDMMRDPEVLFRIDFTNKEAVPCYYRNDYLGKEDNIRYGYRHKGLDAFCDVWFKNLKNQGFNPECVEREGI